MKLSDFTKKQGVKKLTSKQKKKVVGGNSNCPYSTNNPPKQYVNWGNM